LTSVVPHPSVPLEAIVGCHSQHRRPSGRDDEGTLTIASTRDGRSEQRGSVTSVDQGMHHSRRALAYVVTVVAYGWM